MLNNASILITGGTGSFGNACVEAILNNYKPRRLIIFSRDELKQFEMNQRFSTADYDCLRYFIGDVRDKERVSIALKDVDVVIHAAAMKHVPASEYNPTEAIKTNIVGATNIIDAASERGVSRVVALSTDKAVNPVNLYGATKLCSDKLFVAANAYTGCKTKFSVVRYGNVMGSRGSVIPFFAKKKAEGVLPITDPRMTRFWISLEDGVELVLNTVKNAFGGEIMVPKIPSMNIMDLAEAMAPGCPTKIVGIRAGEKIHECMIPAEDSRHTVDIGQYYVILPDTEIFNYQGDAKNAPRVSEGFEYDSGTNDWWLTIEEMRTLLTTMGYIK
ncbi:UDP-N-acetylglucosamine 4,6-dehydratase (inverting) [Desulfovibrio litoralis]|uniref:UDP-N-acetylglucosamine 4,6-dehydratase (Inverting) n=1 Tax=Desulfovibrio litoralis DSM 11393 TaxID=1121455 RepID=A0A1M7T6C4_9BACT|nr:UDP-N-acetylglucosamine 4,6-dehydratase (inverting) [Desulfovibrio litoralis]SHN66248.1 UDP-N-acetylglucosamine 4,6-dehydratase (inverting) [Desulfovibrio litoralis DSM 11393]